MLSKHTLERNTSVAVYLHMYILLENKTGNIYYLTKLLLIKLSSTDILYLTAFLYFHICHKTIDKKDNSLKYKNDTNKPNRTVSISSLLKA